MLSCNSKKNQNKQSDQQGKDDFKYLTEQFADIKIMRYQVNGFENLSLNQKKLIYYLSQASLCGRDIIFDQNYKYNLLVRRTNENIYNTYKGNRESDEFEKFVIYCKRVWFSNGIHHHYSTDKFFPEFTEAYFKELIENSDAKGFEMEKNEKTDAFVSRISKIIFSPDVAPKRVCQDAGMDLLDCSAMNFYEGVSQKEAEDFYNTQKLNAEAKNGKMKHEPISYGLNSKLIKENGKIIEKIWKAGGMYDAAIQKIIYWLEKAITVAENAQQKKHLELLVTYYKSGDLSDWDAYNIEWVKDTVSFVDYVNGFIEIYGDPMSYKASFEGLINFKDIEATKRAQAISENALWFEQHSPVDAKFKKTEVKGVSAKVITAAQLAGDCYPSTPIGINLPNANWIRRTFGSKSVTIDNITYAYEMAALGNGFLEEFSFDEKEIELQKKYGYIADQLHTDLHECVGHGSGKMLPGITSDALKNYHSPVEEARADLFALYYLMDEKLVEIGVMPSLDVAKAGYQDYIRNGIMGQLTRIQLGKNIEQAHMRCRALIANWCYEKGKAERIIAKETKGCCNTYFVVNDFKKLRNLFGELLVAVQRIVSEGDYEAAKNLVENYGVKIDQSLHQEVLARYQKLNIAPYGGFINPVFEPIEKDGEIIDIKITYPEDFAAQNIWYSKNYSFLPVIN